MELNEILKGEDKPETPAETPVETTQETVQEAPQEDKRSTHAKHMEREYEAQGRNPDGTFKAKEPPTEAKAEPAKEPAKEPKQEMSERERGLLAAGQRERQMRQELERRLAALEQQRQLSQQTTQQPAEPPKTFWDNPDQALQKFQQDIGNQITATRLQTAAAIARTRYPDYEERVAVFADLANKTPGLAERCMASPDPAEFAYRTSLHHMELEQAGGDLTTYRKKIEEETAARIRKEIDDANKAKESQRQALAASLPRSLSDVRGTPQTGSQVWGGPTSLEAILRK